MSDEKPEKFVHTSWAEMRAEREAEEPGFNRLVRLEGVWFDISQEIAARPEETEPIDPALWKNATLGRMEAVSHTFDDPALLRIELIGLAADVVEWIEQVDAAKDEA